MTKFKKVGILFLFILLNATTRAEILTGFAALIGHSPDNPALAGLLAELQNEQINTVFNAAADVYEIKSYDRGISLIFNRNMVLKEVQMYDSGYLYKRYAGKMPYGLTFDDKLSDYNMYQQKEYTTTLFNPYIYTRVLERFTIKLYFKDEKIELIKLIGNKQYINQTDSVLRAMWGFRVIPDGKCVEGNCIEGTGKMTWDGNLSYVGAWSNGIPHGVGVLKNLDGFMYSGGFQAGFFWGNGELQMPDSLTYNGLFIYGKKNGEGNIAYQNGTRYNGYWINDLFHGQGQFWFSENYYYVGQFAYNQFNGNGVMYSPEGELSGTFKDGKPHGYCEQFVTRNHITLSGLWVDGKKEGEFYLSNPITGTTKMYFKNDVEVPENE
ncbi:MAG: hypothetical protein H6607_02035 [Flavobacteriales bacterium]|nr:hypothetical protein [Flavobacteriales bacterium]